MSKPPARIQERLIRQSIGLLASYSWQATVTLEPMELGQAEVDLALPEFFREFRLRHAIATAGSLHDIVATIESAPSHVSGVERAESRGVIHGRLDTPRYLARRATLRSLPRPYPVVSERLTYGTPDNLLTVLALREVHTMMRDSPFDESSAEGVAANAHLRWAADRLAHRPWSEIGRPGLRERIRNEVVTRVRRRQTGNDQAYSRLLDWYDRWTLDVHRLGAAAQDEVIRGVMAFPAGEAFWDKVFEVWCLSFAALTLDLLGWTRLAGPVALHSANGEIYVYLTPTGQQVSIRFQRRQPLPAGRWTYRGAGPLRGVPDLTISTVASASAPLLIDAKNRFVSSERVARSEETYKMLGYAENFRDGFADGRFRGVLIFPSNQTGVRIIDGPEDGRIDLVTVNLEDDPEGLTAALAGAVTSWAWP